MCTHFSNETVASWLDSQIAVMDCWLESETLNRPDDFRLMETLQTHRNWLKRERRLLSGLPTECIAMEAAE